MPFLVSINMVLFNTNHFNDEHIKRHRQTEVNKYIQRDRNIKRHGDRNR